MNKRIKKKFRKRLNLRHYRYNSKYSKNFIKYLMLTVAKAAEIPIPILVDDYEVENFAINIAEASQLFPPDIKLIDITLKPQHDTPEEDSNEQKNQKET